MAAPAATRSSKADSPSTCGDGPRRGKVEDPADVAVAAAGAVEGGGDVGLFEAVEEHGQVGEARRRRCRRRRRGAASRWRSRTGRGPDQGRRGRLRGRRLPGTGSPPTSRGGDRGCTSSALRMASSAGSGRRRRRPARTPRSAPAIQNGLPWARAAVTVSSASARASSTLPTTGSTRSLPARPTTCASPGCPTRPAATSSASSIRPAYSWAAASTSRCTPGSKGS